MHICISAAMSEGAACCMTHDRSHNLCFWNVVAHAPSLSCGQYGQNVGDDSAR